MSYLKKTSVKRTGCSKLRVNMIERLFILYKYYVKFQILCSNYSFKYNINILKSRVDIPVLDYIWQLKDVFQKPEVANSDFKIKYAVDSWPLSIIPGTEKLTGFQKSEASGSGSTKSPLVKL